MQTDYDNNLQSYFTDMEHLRGMFKDYVSAEKLPKRLIVLHGVGGVGKSSLLRMFRLHCKSERIPVALASGDDAKSALDVVTRWAEDLKEDGIKLPSLSKTLGTYRAIQAKVDTEVKKANEQIGDLATKVAVTAVSMIPGVGPIGGMVGIGAEALTDWLRGFLSKPDIDLLLDPAKKLSADFLEDIAKAAEKKRMVLLLDTFEQMSALEDWVGETAQKIHPNVLMVIAGRKLPDWNRFWSGWMMNAQVEELKPITEDIMRELIHRYYATMRGGEPDPAQVEAIIRFARGLPMVVTSAVQLWVKYGVEDFQSVKAEIVANLVDRLMEGVPSNLIPALEAAAVVRWFDQPILRAVTRQEDVRDVYNELRRFPFVRSRSEGLALHDSVREMMDENLRVQDSERHSELHERAAMYFEKRLEKATGEEVERLGLERLYHRVRADEETGIKLFQEMAEDLARYRLVNRLRAVLNDVNTYPLEVENSRLWREYYNARAAYLGAGFYEAEKIYQLIGENGHAEPRLRAYALYNLGTTLSRWQRLGETGAIKRAISVLEQSLTFVPLDVFLIGAITRLAHVYRYQGDWEKTITHNKKVVDFFLANGNEYGLLDAYQAEKTSYASTGEWSEMIKAHEIGMRILDKLPVHSHARSFFITASAWAWSLIGRNADIEANLRKTMFTAQQIDDSQSIYWANMQLGLTLTFQDRFEEANRHFIDGSSTLQSLGEGYDTHIAYNQGFWGLLCIKQSKWEDAKEKLIQSLTTRERFKLNIDIPEVLVWLGQLYEVTQENDTALSWYERSLKLKWVGRNNFICEALAGLIRVKHVQGDYAAIPPLLAEAEQLAQQYEYNDHLASLRLTQGHLTSPPTPLLKGEGSEISALDYYKQAMIYALRYNRFLLDELISGRPQGTPLRPIIPYCLERGEEGEKILSALRDWWKIGINDVGTPRLDTISPIPEGIPLLEAEKIAREREPGDGSMQRNVIEQIEAAIGK